MRPLFIYKYEKKMVRKSQEFFDLFQKQATQIERDFAEENKTNCKTIRVTKLGEMGSDSSFLSKSLQRRSDSMSYNSKHVTTD